MDEPLSSRVEQFDAEVARVSQTADQLEVDAGIQHQVVHGDENTEVVTEGGPVPTMKRLQKQLREELGQDAVTTEAWAAAMAAADAKTATEFARDAAQALTNSHLTEEAGRLASADNALFSVVGSGRIAAYIYKRLNAGASQLMVALSSNDAIEKPVWMGKRNGWPDTFFRKFDLTSQDFLGRDRWFWNLVGAGAFDGWTRVANAVYDGYALRRTIAGNAPLNGPAIWLDEIGAAPGDTITIYALIIGNNSSVIGYGRFANSAEVHQGAQVVARNVAGAQAAQVAGATPVRLRFTEVVPDGATRFHFYPTTDTQGGTFDIVALWAFKGDASAGPSWPTLIDTSYLDARVVELQTATATIPSLNASVATLSTTVSKPPQAGKRNGWFDTFFRHFDLSADIYLGKKRWYVSGAATFGSYSRVRNPVFDGYALRRAAGAGNAPLNGPLIHISDLGAEPGDTITVYGLFVGDGGKVTLYGYFRNAANGGVGAQLGGKSVSGAAAITASATPQWQKIEAVVPEGADRIWLYPVTFTANKGFDLIALWAFRGPASEGPAWPVFADDAFQEAKLADLEAKITAAQNPSEAPEVVTPPTIYGVQGLECNFYPDNVFADDAADYAINIDTTGGVGTHQNERWTWAPVGVLNAGALTLSVHKKRTGDQLLSKTIQLRAAGAEAGAGLNTKLLVIADSLVNAGVITQTMLDLAAADVMALTLLGTRYTTSQTNRHEGRGGWSINDYTTAGRTYYSFTVSGVVTPPAINSTTYTNNGNTYTVQEMDLVDGAGILTCSVTPLNGAPQANGVLTKAAGAGDAMITFSASTPVSGNPFWKNGQLDFAAYLATYGIAVPDKVIIGLGTNDAFAYTDDASVVAAAAAAFAKKDQLIASIKAANAAVRIGIALVPPGASDQDAFGASYGTGQARWRVKRNYTIWNRELIAHYQGVSGVDVLPSNVAIDTVNGYPRGAASPVNSRSTVLASRQINAVHPESAYKQMGDSWWAWCKYSA